MLKSDESRFFKKNLISQFWGKKGSKCFFLILKKIGSLLFAINGAKWKYIMSFKFLRKPHVQEKSGSQDMGQNPQSGWGSWAICLTVTSCVPIPYGKSEGGNLYFNSVIIRYLKGIIVKIINHITEVLLMQNK